MSVNTETISPSVQLDNVAQFSDALRSRLLPADALNDPSFTEVEDEFSIALHDRSLVVGGEVHRLGARAIEILNLIGTLPRGAYVSNRALYAAGFGTHGLSDRAKPPTFNKGMNQLRAVIARSEVENLIAVSNYQGLGWCAMSPAVRFYDADSREPQHIDPADVRARSLALSGPSLISPEKMALHLGRLRRSNSAKLPYKPPQESTSKPSAPADSQSGSWQNRAACRGVDGDIFYPDNMNSRKQVTPAKAICMECPVRPECLEDAQETEEPFGIRGGLTPKERRLFRRHTA